MYVNIKCIYYIISTTHINSITCSDTKMSNITTGTHITRAHIHLINTPLSLSRPMGSRRIGHATLELSLRRNRHSVAIARTPRSRYRQGDLYGYVLLRGCGPGYDHSFPSLLFHLASLRNRLHRPLAATTAAPSRSRRRPAHLQRIADSVRLRGSPTVR